MSEQAKKVYRYNNKVKTALKPKALAQVVAEHQTTGDTKSRIIATAVEFYFNHRNAFSSQSKNTY